jgi:hypothetical protein
MAGYTAWYPENRQLEEIVFRVDTGYGYRRVVGLTIPVGLPWDVRYAVNYQMCHWLEPR